MSPQKKLEQFFEKYPARHIAKKGLILEPHKVTKQAFYLRNGFVRLYVQSPSGTVLYLHILKPGSCFPLLSVMTKESQRYYYEAMTPVTLVAAPIGDVRAYVMNDVDILGYFSEKLLMGIEGLLTRLESLVMDSAYVKTGLLFLLFARTFGRPEGESTVIEVTMSHKQIASWIGSARETATLAAEALRQKGFIQYRNRRYTVVSIQALTEEILQAKQSR